MSHIQWVSRQNKLEVYYYESIKRELKRRLIYEYRCDERLKTKTEESTRLKIEFIMNLIESIKRKLKIRCI
jgi:hypothetical protein